MTFGPDFIALQTENVDELARFYEETVEMKRLPEAPPGAILFDTKPVPFAVRTPLDRLAGEKKTGDGISLWMRCENAPELYAKLKAKGVTIRTELSPSPFGMHFAFVDPQGYTITMHDKG